MKINMGPIMSKVSVYAKSAEGKGRMKEYIGQCRSQGRSETFGGSTIITEDEMVVAAGHMVQLIQEAGRNASLPESVMNHLSNLEVSPPTHRPDGSVAVYIYFSGDLHRDSLEDDSDYYGGEFGGRTGEGVDNIVALFNNGANAKNFVYGSWSGHNPTGYALDRSAGDLKPGYAWVRSRKDREALHFIQKAVDTFNDTWGTLYNTTAVAGDEYK